MTTWHGCKNILVIRADNTGDVLMSSPAIRALKDSFNCRITLLTSTDTSEVVSLLPMVDETIAVDLPWVKLKANHATHIVEKLVSQLKVASFDACVIFTVYSQSPLPAAMLAWMAGIPRRLAYCRENPYELLNDWIPEKEPYELIKPQVERDLDLVERVGAVAKEKKITVAIKENAISSVRIKLEALGINLSKPFIVLHPGVSEEKRQFPEEKWEELAKEMLKLLDTQIVFSGSDSESSITNRLKDRVKDNSLSTGGLFRIDEFAALLQMSKLVISVNTATVHLATAVETPLVVLYAQTNPQHHPWMGNARVLEYSIDEQIKSKNEVIRYVDRKYYADYLPLPSVNDIMQAVLSMW
jgi:lipopolysaccharide heptosyltransferase II